MAKGEKSKSSKGSKDSKGLVGFVYGGGMKASHCKLLKSRVQIMMQFMNPMLFHTMVKGQLSNIMLPKAQMMTSTNSKKNLTVKPVHLFLL